MNKRGAAFGHRAAVISGGNKGDLSLVVKIVSTTANEQLGVEATSGELVTPLLPTPRVQVVNKYYDFTSMGSTYQEGDYLVIISASVLSLFPSIEVYLAQDEGVYIRSSEGDMQVLGYNLSHIGDSLTEYNVHCRGVGRDD